MSKWSSLPIPIVKKDEDIHIVADYSKLNSVTILDKDGPWRSLLNYRLFKLEEGGGDVVKGHLISHFIQQYWLLKREHFLLL